MTGNVKVCSFPDLAARPALLTMFFGKQQRLGQLARTGILLAAALALPTLFDARPAAASCGDYVMVGGHGHHHDSSDHHPGTPGVPTCHGPNCQRQAPVPLAPTKGLPERLLSDVACWLQIRETIEPPLSGWIFEGRISLAEGHSLPPLRPPCL